MLDGVLKLLSESGDMLRKFTFTGANAKQF